MPASHLRRFVSIGLVAAAAFLGTGCYSLPGGVRGRGGTGGQATQLPAPGPSVGKPRVPGSGAYFGLWLNPVAGLTDQASVQSAWTARETNLGRTFDIAQSYYTFGSAFPTWRETWHLRHGRTPLISWNGTTSSEVVSGRQDALIRTRARAVKALGAPVFLRYFWEPDAQKKVAMAESPYAYIANFRRVHAIFAEEGVTNASWVWCPTAWGFRNGTAQPYYPGDDVVDWMCADGYNWGTVKGANNWPDWYTIYGASYAFSQAHRKPLMAGEFGSVERNAGDKAAWIRTSAAQIKAMPGIKAVVYFDSRRIENDVWMDWRTDSSSDAWAAFHAMGDDPYFNP